MRTLGVLVARLLCLSSFIHASWNLVIHIESPVQQSFILGEFFIEWDVGLSTIAWAGCRAVTERCCGPSLIATRDWQRCRDAHHGARRKS